MEHVDALTSSAMAFLEMSSTSSADDYTSEEFVSEEAP